MIQKRLIVRKVKVLMVASRKSVEGFIYFYRNKAPVVEFKELKGFDMVLWFSVQTATSLPQDRL